MAEQRSSERRYLRISLVSGLLGGAAGWLTASYKIEKEFHIRQAESGYEALVKANRLKWRAEELEPYPDRAPEVAELKKESDDSYFVARHNIAAFGDERIVKALSDYWSKYGGAARSCADKEKFALDTKIYMAVRNTLGVRGSVSEEQIANVVFLCSLR